MKTNELNPLVLAYLGDSIYEVYVRKYLIEKGISHVNDLQKEAIKYVSAKSQSKILEELTNNNFLKEEELEIIRHARNTKIGSHPKGASIIEYRYATGLEALVGSLYLDNEVTRLDEIMREVFDKC